MRVSNVFDDRKQNMRGILFRMKNLLDSRHERVRGILGKRMSGIRIAVEFRETAAGNLNPDAVSPEQCHAGRPAVDFESCDLVRLKRRRSSQGFFLTAKLFIIMPGKHLFLIYT